MAIWAEIQKALNSTLLTANFKPLNEIVMQTKDLAADDRVYKVLYPTGTSTISSISFTAHRNGSVRILLPVTSNSSSQNINTYRIRVFVSETSIVDTSYTIRINDPAQILTADLSISNGQTYRIAVSESGNGSSVPNGLMIGAVELDVTGITIE